MNKMKGTECTCTFSVTFGGSAATKFRKIVQREHPKSVIFLRVIALSLSLSLSPSLFFTESPAELFGKPADKFPDPSANATPCVRVRMPGGRSHVHSSGSLEEKGGGR